MRAPAPSLSPTSGAPTLRARSISLWIFSAKTSPSAPPKTVKSCENTNTLRPSTVPQPVITPSVYGPLLEPGRVGPVAGQQVELVERSLVEEVLDALPGQQLALGVLTFDGSGRAGVVGLLAPLLQVVDLVLHRVGACHGADASGAARRGSQWRAPILRSLASRSERSEQRQNRSATIAVDAVGGLVGDEVADAGELDVAGAGDRAGRGACRCARGSAGPRSRARRSSARSIRRRRWAPCQAAMARAWSSTANRGVGRRAIARAISSTASGWSPAEPGPGDRRPPLAQERAQRDARRRAGQQAGRHLGRRGDVLRAGRPRAQQHDPPDPIGPADGQLLGDHPAHRQARRRSGRSRPSRSMTSRASPARSPIVYGRGACRDHPLPRLSMRTTRWSRSSSATIAPATPGPTPSTR